MQFENLPPDTLRQIALQLPAKDLLNYCNISRRFRLLCSNDYFWRDRVAQDYPDMIEPERPITDYYGLFRYLTGRNMYLTSSVDRAWVDTQGLISSKFRTRPPKYFIMEYEDVPELMTSISYGGEGGPLVTSEIFDSQPDLRDGDLIGFYVQGDTNRIPLYTGYIHRTPSGRLNIAYNYWDDNIFPNRFYRDHPEDFSVIARLYGLRFGNSADEMRQWRDFQREWRGEDDAESDIDDIASEESEGFEDSDDELD